jgi:hypothetical protein
MATTATKKSAAVEPPKMGRPKSAYAERYYLRHHMPQIEAWRAAAISSGKTLHQWMLEALDGEAKKPHHVPVLKRVRG